MTRTLREVVQITKGYMRLFPKHASSRHLRHPKFPNILSTQHFVDRPGGSSPGRLDAWQALTFFWVVVECLGLGWATEGGRGGTRLKKQFGKKNL